MARSMTLETQAARLASTDPARLLLNGPLLTSATVTGIWGSVISPRWVFVSDRRLLVLILCGILLTSVPVATKVFGLAILVSRPPLIFLILSLVSPLMTFSRVALHGESMIASLPRLDSSVLTLEIIFYILEGVVLTLLLNAC